mgnify:CR=1 FL=1
MLENTVLKSTRNQGATKTTKVIIADIIWFSVILEASIPIEVAAIATNINPNILVNKIGIFISPKKLTIIEYIAESITVIRITMIAARNFPSTIDVTLLGDVSNNCSVPFFFFSYNILIVRSGTINNKPYLAVA